MKKRVCAGLTALLLAGVLSGCGCGSGGEEAGLVFVNNSDAAIVEVVVGFTDQSSGARRADSCPLERGESFGFEVGEYPVTVTVYDQILGNSGQKELAFTTINNAPPVGDRWYVTARDGVNGVILSVDTRWQPEA